jgi:hypothetical protein
MEGLRFAMGVAKKKTRTQKKEEFRKKLLDNIKKNRREEQALFIRLGICPPPIVPDPRYILKHKRWFLLRGVPNEVDVFMYHAGDTFHQILASIRNKLRYGKDVARYKALRVLARKNQRMRRGFELLARHWIRSRLRAGNEEDLLTGSPPVNPIVLIDWKGRRRYIFEPPTLFKDMVTRLQMSYCSVFPKPHFPRNPYTNTNMTAGQFFSIVRQLRSRGMTHWTIEALYSVAYNLQIFEKEMYIKLKNTILHGLFANHHSVAGIEVVMEFIEDQHDAHRLRCNNELYKWALENAPTHPRIVAWRLLCYKYYRIANMIPPHPDTDTISIVSRDLCSRPLGLEALRHKALCPA